MTIKPVVSIITPTFNSERFISETIDSIIQQSYKDWELLVIDDGSDDNSIKIIKEFESKENRVHLIRFKKNYGPAYARNLGIQLAKGRYIAFLDSDDVWHPDKLEIQIKFMLENNLPFSFTSYRKIDDMGKIFGKRIKAPEMLNYNDLLKSCTIGCLTVVYDQRLIGKQFMPDYPKTQDYALWLKIMKTGVKARGIDQELAYYRIRQSSISRNKIIKAFYQWKIYREQENLNFFESIYFMINYTLYGLIKLIR
jgi:glycosyltransferase involved in cell wall biosynthesis